MCTRISTRTTIYGMLDKFMRNFKCTFVLLMLLIFCSTAVAQEIRGIIHDLENSAKLRGIVVKNLNNDEETETDFDGNFTIKGQINDRLRVSGGGYEADTIFIYDEGIRRIYLAKDENTIVINEVYVTRLTDNRLATEIERARREGQALEASQHQGGLRISPSRLFGREGKTARSNLEILLTEQENRLVDRVFTNQLIRAITPLQEDEITFFRETHRPSLEFIQTSTREDLVIYINESYQKFRKDNPVKK